MSRTIGRNESNRRGSKIGQVVGIGRASGDSQTTKNSSPSFDRMHHPSDCELCSTNASDDELAAARAVVLSRAR